MQITLTARQQLTPTTTEFIFTTPEPLNFQPGQFVQLKKIGDEQKNSRAFSMASAPQTNQITFLMKRLAGGVVSGFLDSAPLGTKIECGAPLGKFILNPADTTRVYVATGTGLAPIKSFLEWGKNQTAANISVPPSTLLFGVHDEINLFWTEHLPKNSLITISHPSDTWRGLSGRVTTHLSTLLEKNRTAGWYLCGNPEMIKDVRAQLLAAGVLPANLHFEIY